MEPCSGAYALGMRRVREEPVRAEECRLDCGEEAVFEASTPLHKQVQPALLLLTKNTHDGGSFEIKTLHFVSLGTRVFCEVFSFPCDLFPHFLEIFVIFLSGKYTHTHAETHNQEHT